MLFYTGTKNYNTAKNMPDVIFLTSHSNLTVLRVCCDASRTEKNGFFCNGPVSFVVCPFLICQQYLLRKPASNNSRC